MRRLVMDVEGYRTSLTHFTRSRKGARVIFIQTHLGSRLTRYEYIDDWILDEEQESSCNA